MFDPEKVERVDWFRADAEADNGTEFVAASDYDQLLELYRKAAKELDEALLDHGFIE